MNRRAHAINRQLVRRRVAHDAALADMFPARFELRLYQDDRLDPALATVPHRGKHRRQHQGSGNKRYIHGYEADPGTQFARLEVTRIGAFAQAHARISAQSLGNLPVPGIHRHNAGGTMLQHAIGETTGRGTNISTVPGVEIDVPTIERGLQLEPAAADVALLFSQYPQQRSVVDGGPRLLYFLLVDKHAAGEDQRLRALP